MPTPIRVNGAKLAEVRIRAGLSRAALATAAGVNRSNVWRIECGQSQPVPATLVALATALGVDIDAITDRSAA